MITLNKIKTILKTWFEGHKQVRHFYWGDVYDYSAETGKEYVSVNTEYIDTNLNGKFLNHSYRISIGDLIDPNVPEQEHEIISDCMNIATDFFAYMELMEEFTLLTNSNVQPFSDSTGDRISGVAFTIVLQVHRQANECAIPN